MNGQGNQLITLADLADRHMGRTVTVRGITGELVGVRPVGARVALTLLDAAGVQILTDAYMAGEHVLIHERTPS